MNSLKTAGDLLSLLLSFRMMRSQGKGTVQAKLLEDPEAPVMRLEESHYKQTPNLNKREWGLHQHSQKVHPDSLSLTCTIHTLTHHLPALCTTSLFLPTTKPNQVEVLQ